MYFLWDERNEAHIGKHGIMPDEAEHVVRRAKRPYPKQSSSVKWLVKGRTVAGRLIQVIYVEREDDEIGVERLSFEQRLAFEQNETAVYVIHARPLRRGEE